MKRGFYGVAVRGAPLEPCAPSDGAWIWSENRKRVKNGYPPLKITHSHQQPSRKPITLASLPKPRSA